MAREDNTSDVILTDIRHFLSHGIIFFGQTGRGKTMAMSTQILQYIFLSKFTPKVLI